MATTEQELQSLQRIYDRLDSTSNSDLGGILQNLLPKLIPLANKELLTLRVMEIVNLCLSRIKTSPITLPLEKLLELANSSMLPYSCDIALSFVGTCIERCPTSTHLECTAVLLKSLSSFQPFTKQSNALCNYLLYFLPSIPQAWQNHVDVQYAVQGIVGDWLLDIAISTDGIRRDRVGSNQHGLSTERIERLTSLEISCNYKQTKLQIMSLLGSNIALVSAEYAVAISIVLSCDNDLDISSQAVHKMNGAMILFKVLEHSDKVADVLLKILTVSLGNCGAITDRLTPLQYLCLFRTSFRDSVRSTVCRWLAKELHLSLSCIAIPLASWCSDNLFQNQLITMQLKAASVNLLSRIAHSLAISDLSTLSAVAPELLQIVEQALKSYSSYVGSSVTSSVTTAVAGDFENNLALRKDCYAIVQLLGEHCAGAVIVRQSIIVLLFRLVDNEDERLMTSLYCALSSVRDVYCGNDLRDLDTSQLESLQEMLRSMRASPGGSAKKFLAVVEWTRATSGWSFFTLETLVWLADNDNESVRFAVTSEFVKLKALLTRKHSTINLAQSVEIVQNLFKLLENLSQLQSCALANHVNAVTSLFQVTNTFLQFLLSTSCNYEPESFMFNGGSAWLSLKSNDNWSPEIVCVAGHVESAVSSIVTLTTSWSCKLSQVFAAAHLTRNLLMIWTRLIKHSQLQKSAISCWLHWVNNEATSIVSQPCPYVGQCMGLACLLCDSDQFSHIARSLWLKYQSSSSSQGKIVILTALARIVEAMIVRHCDNDIGYLMSSSSIIADLEWNRFCIQFVSAAYDVLKLSFSNCETNKMLLVGTFQALTYVGSRELFSSHVAIIPTTTSEELFIQALCFLDTTNDRSISDACIEFLTRSLRSSESSFLEQANCVLTRLLTVQSLDVNQINSKFIISEGIVRLALSTDNDRAENNWQKLIALVERGLNKTCTVAITIRSTSAVLLLVLLKELILSKSERQSQEFMLTCTEKFLSCLQEQDAFVQDIGCLGLAHLYHSSAARDPSLANAVATEVINVLTRQRKGFQPAGVAVAGESSGTSAEGDAARAMEGSTRTANLDDNNSNRNANTAATNSTQGDLAAAAARAAEELGLSQDNIDAAVAARLHAATNVHSSVVHEHKFGIYSTVCKIAKNTGDAAVVFAVLSLIRRDPSFGAVGSDTWEVYGRHQAPVTEIAPAEITKMIPILFMSKFDPAAMVRNVMKSLWDMLIVQTRHEDMVVCEHAHILKFLMSQLSSLNWRDRESACSALESFLGQRSWNEIKPYAAELWITGMNVLDDVRDSTRVTGMGFMKVLADQILRACDPAESLGASSHAALSIIMPILIEKGLIVPSAEGKGFSLGLLVKIVKSCRNSLDEYLVDLIGLMVEAMSAMEPKTFQYMQFHTTRLQISDEELENMRIKLAQQSPMQETLDGCLQSLNSTLIPDVIAKLSNELNRGVGFATRIAAAQALTYLTQLYPAEASTGTCVISMQKAFHHIVSSLANSGYMSIAMKKAFMTALGGLAKVVPSAEVARECDDLISVYATIGRDDNNSAGVISTCLQQIVTKAGDRLSDGALWNRILACSYVGTFDTDEECQRTWQSLWSEVIVFSAAGTKSHALIRCVTGVFDTVQSLLQDLSWNKRRQGLLVLTDLTGAAPLGLLEAFMPLALELLFRGTSGRRWTGQHLVLSTLSGLLSKFPSCLEYDYDNSTEILRVRLREDSNIEVLARLEEVTIAQAVDDTIDCPHATSVKEFSSLSHQYSSWKVSIRPLVHWMLRECDRGDKEYRLTAAKALAALPWTTISVACPLLFNDLLPIFYTHANIVFVLPSQLSSAVSTGGGGGGVDSAGSKRLNEQAASMSRAANAKKYNTQHHTSSLFGSRYGGAGAGSGATQSKPATRSVTGNSNSAAGVSRLASAQTRSAPSPPSSLPIPPSSSSISSSSGSTLQPSLVTSDVDPAFRMKFVECISQGWPDSAAITITPHQDHDTLTAVSDDHAKLLVWVCSSLTAEVWSLRLVCLQLLGKLCARELTTVQLTSAMSAVQTALSDQKYSKIRCAALECLKCVIGGRNREMVRSLFSDTVHAIIRQCGNDTVPAVIEACSRLQQKWLSME